jgi:acetylornithine/succinyldiaminopimelate/putrescine aminotransferase
MKVSLAKMLGSRGSEIVTAMQAGLQFLAASDRDRLLERLGEVMKEIPAFEPIDKSALPASYGGSQTTPSDDFLVGRGMFYLNEQRRLFLDCTAGHYQMLWGYNHPELCAAIEEATKVGVVWDNHSNIPQSPLKQLGHRLTELANAPGESDPLNKVHLGLCTGSVACATALKIQLKVFERDRGLDAVPVIIVLDGNYHGTDMLPQFMRGLWPGMVQRCEPVRVQPNDAAQLTAAFQKYGKRVAGFWAEPVLMNREAIAVEAGYLQLARECCDRVGALMCIDEIQTGFWRPEIFDYRALGIRPDLVVLGKGMTAGFHPLSGVLFKRRHDVLEQYDAISTNGSAALPAFVTLCSLNMIEERAQKIRHLAARIQEGFSSLASEFPDQLESARGRGHLAGLKFRRVDDAKAFQKSLFEAGLWTRVHAYHEGHSTILTKLGFLADETVVDFVIGRFRGLLKSSVVRIPTPGDSRKGQPQLA